jgi:predicted nuclease of predicted toxin-antitoxin system
MPWKRIPEPTKDELSEILYERKAKFLVDESLGRGTTEFLRQNKVNVRDVWELGINGKSDEMVYTRAKKGKRVLLTHDEDFLDNRKYPLNASYGIIILPGGSGSENILLEALSGVIGYIWPFGDLFRESKTVISSQGEWTIHFFDRNQGKVKKVKLRFKKNMDLEIWED